MSKRFNDIEKFTFKEFIQKYRDKRSDEIIAYELYLIIYETYLINEKLIIYETYLINEKLDKIMELINDEGD